MNPISSPRAPACWWVGRTHEDSSIALQSALLPRPKDWMYSTSAATSSSVRSRVGIDTTLKPATSSACGFLIDAARYAASATTTRPLSSSTSDPASESHVGPTLRAPLVVWHEAQFFSTAYSRPRGEFPAGATAPPHPARTVAKTISHQLGFVISQPPAKPACPLLDGRQLNRTTRVAPPRVRRCRSR